MDDDPMISLQRGWKWVHDTTLMDNHSHEAIEIATDLPDKKVTPRIGKKVREGLLLQKDAAGGLPTKIPSRQLTRDLTSFRRRTHRNRTSVE